LEDRSGFDGARGESFFSEEELVRIMTRSVAGRSDGGMKIGLARSFDTSYGRSRGLSVGADFSRGSRDPDRTAASPDAEALVAGLKAGFLSGPQSGRGDDRGSALCPAVKRRENARVERPIIGFMLRSHVL
jgi:hypothetical protein